MAKSKTVIVVHSHLGYMKTFEDKSLFIKWFRDMLKYPGRLTIVITKS
jgi:hypothetical protein